MYHSKYPMIGFLLILVFQDCNGAPVTISHLPSDSFACLLCEIIAEEMNDLILSGAEVETLENYVTQFCIRNHILSHRICKMIVKEYEEEFLGVILLEYLSPQSICSSLPILQMCPPPYIPGSDWNVTFPNTTKPPVAPILPPKPGSPVVKVLHLSDFHLDRMYQTGSNAECGEFLCCRSNDGPPKTGKQGAGKWGDYRNCDSPFILLDNLFKNLAQKSLEFDFIYMTGDLPAHDIWNQSRSDQLQVFDSITGLFMKYLPKVKVFPAVGNHESAPADSFPPPYIKGNDSIDWLYEHFASDWIDRTGWLPESTRTDILRGGFFTTLAFPGLRIVSLNMNYGNAGNFWLQINATDPVGMLQWLVDVLQASEDKGEKVHILGHIPPGQCLLVFSKNYYKIVNRYEGTIAGQFFGHTHHDHFEIFYENLETRRPTSVAFIQGSVTTYSTPVNPGYRIYTIDGNYNESSKVVLNFENYILNLTEANLHDKPVWRKEYDAKEAYQMKAMLPADFDDLVQRMITSDELFNLFHKHFLQSYGDSVCSGECKRNMLCSLQSALAGDDSYCDHRYNV